MAQKLEPPHEFFNDKLTRAGAELARILEESQLPVYNQFEFFRQVWKLYNAFEGKGLYLRSKTPGKEEYSRLRLNLRKTSHIAPDRDYGSRAIRVLSVSDRPAEDIVCLMDPACYVSHLSAMQRWGLTDRNPKALIITRLARKRAHQKLLEYRNSILSPDEQNPFEIPLVAHPKIVRKREVTLHETQAAGSYVNIRNSFVRVSTIGQTFLDMMIKPELCGGASHGIEIWQKHALTYKNEIIDAVEQCASEIAKVRSGYILEEKLKVRDPVVQSWKRFAQRGSSRKLDPGKPFSSEYSESWMLSINA